MSEPETAESPALPTPAERAAEIRALDDAAVLDLADKAAEATVLLDKLQRGQAELQNTIKRLRRDNEESLRYANTGLARELLTVLDNLTRALRAANGSSDFAGLFKGLQLTEKMFTEALARHNILPIEAAGKPFDPALHDAVMMTNDSQLEENTVATELERGWTLHDRVLRAAKVAVNKKP